MKVLLACVVAGSATAGTASAQVSAGRMLLESRLRYETVEQAGLSRAADGLSDRTRIGWETVEAKGLRGLIEFETVAPLITGHFNVVNA